MAKGKFVIEWLRELPEPYKGMALVYKRQAYTTSVREPNMAEAIAAAFAWNATDEGYLFWKNVHDFYEGINPQLPPLK